MEQQFKDWLASLGLSLDDCSLPVSTLLNLGNTYLVAAYGEECANKPEATVALFRAAYLHSIDNEWGFKPSVSIEVKRQKLDVMEREFFSASDLHETNPMSKGLAFDPMIHGIMSSLCKKQRNTFFYVV